MNSPNIVKADTPPTSFTFYVAPQQAVSYPGGSSTPKKGTGLVGTLTCVALDAEFVKPWFRQSITPLVGHKAAAALFKVLEQGLVREEAGEFWAQTREFLKSLE